MHRPDETWISSPGGPPQAPLQRAGKYGYASNMRDTRLEYSSDGDILRMTLGGKPRVIVLVMGILGMACLSLPWLIMWLAHASALAFVALGVFFALLGLFFGLGGWLTFWLWPVYELDRGRGQLRYRHDRLWGSGAGPLKRIVAVQSLDDGTESYPGGDGPGQAFRAFELNLVLDNGKRLNVARHGDREWMQKSAREIAAFLNVPHLDHADIPFALPQPGELPPTMSDVLGKLIRIGVDRFRRQRGGRRQKNDTDRGGARPPLPGSRP